MAYFPLPPQPPPSPVCASTEPCTPISLEYISARFNFGFDTPNSELATNHEDLFDDNDPDALFSLDPEGLTSSSCFAKPTPPCGLNHPALSNHEIYSAPENDTDSNTTPSTQEEMRDFFHPSTSARLAIQESPNPAISSINPVPNDAVRKNFVALESTHSEVEAGVQSAKDQGTNRLEDGWLEVKTLTPNWFSSSVDREWVKVPRRLPQPEKIPVMMVMMLQRVEARNDDKSLGDCESADAGGYHLSA
ncbi:hypothetical protein AOQ84DRAFT_50396 [Glonium stellatum]|uniref:Uncharacterized protein n=1 Tax=Glonium stellatum TaxID=574774 RepID=A0A8E2EZT0_9PEZI|nr:hypothetical protein AOQ84DRAFT_50396 [Glonium stellatum]